MLPENPAQVIRVLTLFWSGLLADGKNFSCRGSVLVTVLGVCVFVLGIVLMQKVAIFCSIWEGVLHQLYCRCA
jgi:hypothetical protein